MSYCIDVYTGECRSARSFVDFAAYISLFPQLIAGPIVRYCDVDRQLGERRTSVEMLGTGIRLFSIGLAKKVLLANQFGIVWDSVSANVSSFGTLGAWAGAVAYAMHIYFDFAGYSDMARGLGKMLGFDFCINFNYPYISKSVTEFWRRWHISLRPNPVFGIICIFPSAATGSARAECVLIFSSFGGLRVCGTEPAGILSPGVCITALFCLRKNCSTAKNLPNPPPLSDIYIRFW